MKILNLKKKKADNEINSLPLLHREAKGADRQIRLESAAVFTRLSNPQQLQSILTQRMCNYDFTNEI